MVFIERVSNVRDTLMMVNEKVTDRYSLPTLGIKIPRVIRDCEFTFTDEKTISILRSLKFHHKFLLSYRSCANEASTNKLSILGLFR